MRSTTSTKRTNSAPAPAAPTKMKFGMATAALGFLGILTGLTVGASPSPSASASPSAKPTEKRVDKPHVLLETSLGKIELELDRPEAPATVDNFLAYVEDGFYDGLIFHRVKRDFIIQAGGFDEKMKPRTEGLKKPVKLESRNGKRNLRGAIAMARGPQPNSATSQFFINVSDNPSLDYPNPDGHGYAVFGRVVKGMDVVDRIRTVDVFSHPEYPAPKGEGAVNPRTPVVIRKASLVAADRETD